MARSHILSKNMLHAYTYIHTYILTYIHTYMHIHTYTHTCIVCVYVCMHTYTHTYIHTCIHTYTYTHIHAGLHLLWQGLISSPNNPYTPNRQTTQTTYTTKNNMHARSYGGSHEWQTPDKLAPNSKCSPGAGAGSSVILDDSPGTLERTARRIIGASALLR
jgi:hypothetical protein